MAGRLPTGHSAGAELLEHAAGRAPTGDTHDALADAAAALAASDLTPVQVGAVGQHLAAAWEILTHST
ncbi:MAG: hypothetical protein PGN13_16000 [Patulibacter minatonensis]